MLKEECEILAVETSLKKIIDKHNGRLLSYGYLAQKIAPAKRVQEPVHFTGKDGNRYQLEARRIQ